jgi:hypothetical protein
MKNIWTALALSAACVAGAQAGEVYTGIGTHGVMLGYAQPISDSITIRGDFAGLGSKSDRDTEEGITYDIKAKYNRTGLFADWFFAGGWRLTGGVTFNQVEINMLANGAGQTINVGGTTYVLAPGDSLEVRVEYPKTTPFLGIGYGHQPKAEGFGFHFDLGASIGKAKVTATGRGQLAQPGAQADINRETQEIRDGAGKIKAIPQLSLGVNYRF